MRILVLGANGMAGYGILSSLRKYSSHKIYGSVRRSSGVCGPDIICDLSASDLKKIDSTILDLKIDCVINCIGLIKQKYYSNIDFIHINSVFPHQLSQICAKYNTRLIHLSTDCVFDGSKGNYIETDDPTASDIYGQSKYCGEIEYNNTITIRTSIIGKELNSHNSLIEWFLANQNVSIKGYTNAIFSGFPTITLGNIIKDHILENKTLNGIYHISSDPISKYDLLQIVARYFNKASVIEPDNSVWCNRSLNCNKFKSITGFKSNSWESMILDMYNDWNI